MNTPSPLFDEQMHRRCLFLRLGGLSYGQISDVVGVTRQRVQQITSPKGRARAAVVSYACGTCESCSAFVGLAGQIHHRSTEVSPEQYNTRPNMTLLCVPCHMKAHADPEKAEQRRPRTPEEKAVSYALHGERTAARRHGMTLEEYRAKRATGVDWCSAHKAWEPEDTFYKKSVCFEGNREKTRERSRRITRGELTVKAASESRQKQGAARLGIPFAEYRRHIEAGESWCSGHRGWHPTADFYKNRRTPNGLTSYCRTFSQARQARRKAAAS